MPLILLVMVLCGCASAPESKSIEEQTRAMRIEADMLCAAELYGPGMADWCNH